MEKVVYTVEEIATMLGISRTKAYELAKNGDIPVIRIGRCLRVPVVMFEEWLIKQVAS